MSWEMSFDTVTNIKDMRIMMNMKKAIEMTPQKICTEKSSGMGRGRILPVFLAALLAVSALAGCSSKTSDGFVATSSSVSSAAEASADAAADTAAGSAPATADSVAATAAASAEGSAAVEAPGISGDFAAPLPHEIPSWFEVTDSMKLVYAQEFSVDYDSEGRALICIGTDQQFLLLPDGIEAPDGMTGDCRIINGPLRSIYAASTSTLDLLDKCGGMNQVKLVGTEYKNWTIQSVRDAMDKGDITYVGKYSDPDFEIIAVSDIDFVMENSDIYHSASTLDKLHELGYTVMIERTSAESHPMGRAEWVRLMGLLTGHSEEAEAAFADMRERFEACAINEKSDKTFAYFYVNSSGEASIRLPGNYLIKTIMLAGGNYAFEDIDSADSDNASMKIDMEAFYAAVRDVDILIYNNNKDKTVKDMQSLIARNSLLADCKAVKDGNVWCTGANVYQQVTAVPGLLEDFRSIISGEADGMDKLNYLARLK